MSITTNASISGGYFGYIKKLKNGNETFEKKGKAVYITSIEESIENEDVYLRLEFDYHGKTKALRIVRDEISDPALMKVLAKKGAAGSKDSYSCLVDTLLLQEEEFEEDGGVTQVYEHLGWISLPDYDEEGNFIEYKPCFRADQLCGHTDATYIGSFDVAPYGSYKEWRTMVIEEVVPTPVLQLVLVAALASVVLGLIAPYRSCENPIIHLCYASGRGKTTALECAASTAGRVFEGQRYEVDDYGQHVVKQSVFQSWSSTDNAMIARQAGNRGVVTVLNELGKSLSPNLTRLIFDLSEGSDKARLTKDLQLRVSEGYTTVFISCGESSLLDRCKSKYEGLKIRVMEINQPITTSAEQARRIKTTCRENGGFAAKKLAQHIINQGGATYILPIYDRWNDDLQNVMTSVNSKERFIEKFAALFMATAEVATDALKIPFDLESLQTFLVEYDKTADAGRNSAAESYQEIIDECLMNRKNFFIGNDQVPVNQAWGRICTTGKVHKDGRRITHEYLVRRPIVQELLKKYGHTNINTCIAAWEAAGVLSRDKDRPTRSRMIDPAAKKEDVFVFRVFEDNTVSEPEDDVLPIVTVKLPKHKSNIHKLLAESEEEADGDDTQDAHTA